MQACIQQPVFALAETDRQTDIYLSTFYIQLAYREERMAPHGVVAPLFLGEIEIASEPHDTITRCFDQPTLLWAGQM